MAPKERNIAMMGYRSVGEWMFVLILILKGQEITSELRQNRINSLAMAIAITLIRNIN